MSVTSIKAEAHAHTSPNVGSMMGWGQDPVATSYAASVDGHAHADPGISWSRHTDFNERLTFRNGAHDWLMSPEPAQPVCVGDH